MNFKEKEKFIIICICGKAGSGKSLAANYIYEEYTKKNKKVIISPYTKYLKKYVSEILEKKINEKNKPRTMLQKLSSELIKKKLGYEDFFIKRQLEDISIYKFFFDVVIIPDVRFPNEIECLKNKEYKVISIGIKRENYNNKLTTEQKSDITEIALDNYNKYDFIIQNNNTNYFKKEIKEIIRKVDKNE